MSLPISLIIPTYNEEKNIPKILSNIKLLKPKEVLVVDAHSIDKTKKMLQKVKTISCEPSRGLQLYTGAKRSKQPWLLFIHADTMLNGLNIKEIKTFIKEKNTHSIAYFNLKFNNSSFFARLIWQWANLRTKLFYLPFGDQCLFVYKKYYEKIGGHSKIPTMEDMDLVLRVPNKNKVLFNSYVITSFRKYKKNGVFKQSIKNIFNQIVFLLK